MEAQSNGHAKLSRTQSSLLRSSIYSLSSINEDVFLSAQNEGQKKDQKNHQKPASTPRIGSARFTAPILGMALVVSISFCSFFFYLFYFFYLGTQEIPTSENMLLLLIFIAIVLYFASKNKALIHRTLSILKRFCDGNTKRLKISKSSSEPIRWFIGDSPTTNKVGRNNRVIKEGVEFYSNGDYYEGEFHNGKCNGSGVYNFSVTGRYEGDWVDGRYDGYGIENWARGSRYKGQYRQGLRQGYGIYRFYTGDSYAGEWFNGQSHGVGVQTCSDGSSYVGEFKYGVKHGLGCYHFRNGDKYAGEYFGDKIHGFGVYHFANGHCYEGAWHEGRRQGYGMYTFRNGDRRCGEWDAGNLKHSLPPLTDAILRAVLAARRTMKNATNLPRKDDGVNKAVIAANSAATAARVAAVKAVQNRMNGKFCKTDV